MVSFILSTGRTGTTFLGDHFLPNAPGVTAFHEPQPDFFDLGADYARGDVDPSPAERTIRSNRKWVLLKMEQSGTHHYVETNHYLFSLVPILNRVFPKPRYTHIVRDGRDVVRSAYNMSWYKPSSPYDRMTAADLPEDPFADEWEQLNRFEKISWYWQAKDRMIGELLVDEPRTLTVRFEELFDPESKYSGIERLLSFLSIEWSDWKPLMNQPRRSTTDYELPHWTDWTRERRDRFRRIAGDRLRFHGYDWKDNQPSRTT